MKRLLGFVFFAVMLAACAPELDNETAEGEGGIVVCAQCATTKSVLQSDLSVNWSAEDRITVLSLDGSTTVVSGQGGAESPTCEFKINGWPATVEPRYAVFNGASDEVSASIEGRYIRASIKTAQFLSDEASFGRDANLSIGELKAAQDGRWQTEMKNVCALVGFSLDRFDNVKAVSVYNRSGGKSLSGSFDIFVEDGIPVIKEVVDGKTYATVSMADGGSCFKTGTTYYICVRPDVDFSPDFVFLLSDGKRYRYRFEETVRIRRSTVRNFGVVDTEAFESELDSAVSNENFIEGGSIELEVLENSLLLRH